MIRIRTDLTALPEDDAAVAAEAYAAGWRIDEDFWWVRKTRDNEPRELDHEVCFIVSGHAFSPNADEALKFDARLTP